MLELEQTEILVPIGHQMIFNFEQADLVHMLKAQMIMEFDDKDVKKIKLEQLQNIENTVYIRIAGHERVYAKGSQDLNTSNTAMIHNVLFDFKPGEVVDFKYLKNTVVLGITHDMYTYEITLKDTVKEQLIKNFN